MTDLIDVSRALAQIFHDEESLQARRKRLVIADSDSPRSEAFFFFQNLRNAYNRVSVRALVEFRFNQWSHRWCIQTHVIATLDLFPDTVADGRFRIGRSSSDQRRKCSATDARNEVKSRERRLRTRIVDSGAAFAQRKKKEREKRAARAARRCLDAEDSRGLFRSLASGIGVVAGRTGGAARDRNNGERRDFDRERRPRRPPWWLSAVIESRERAGRRERRIRKPRRARNGGRLQKYHVPGAPWRSCGRRDSRLAALRPRTAVPLALSLSFSLSPLSHSLPLLFLVLGSHIDDYALSSSHLFASSIDDSRLLVVTLSLHPSLPLRLTVPMTGTLRLRRRERWRRWRRRRPTAAVTATRYRGGVMPRRSTRLRDARLKRLEMHDGRTSAIVFIRRHTGTQLERGKRSCCCCCCCSFTALAGGRQGGAPCFDSREPRAPASRSAGTRRSPSAAEVRRRRPGHQFLNGTGTGARWSAFALVSLDFAWITRARTEGTIGRGAMCRANVTRRARGRRTSVRRRRIDR